MLFVIVRKVEKQTVKSALVPSVLFTSIMPAFRARLTSIHVLAVGEASDSAKAQLRLLVYQYNGVAVSFLRCMVAFPRSTSMNLIRHSCRLVLTVLFSATCCMAGAQNPAPDSAIEPGGLLGRRFLTLNTVVRVRQIEVTRDTAHGPDESSVHTAAEARTFREAIEKAWPGARITWAFSWLALHDTRESYRELRELVVSYHDKFGDEMTFIPGAYFANMYNSREQVNRDLHDGLRRVSEIVGDGYRPKSVVAGFLAADNLIVNLDGWTVDFLCARIPGRKMVNGEPWRSRQGVGPIETLLDMGTERGLKSMLATTATHFDDGFQRNGFAWVTCGWEMSLVEARKIYGYGGRNGMEGLHLWLTEIRKRWPAAKLITQGEFGELWRAQFKNNDKLDYQFTHQGSGIRASQEELEIRWFMNRDFRLALLRNWKENGTPKVIDFTRYDLPANEPADPELGKESRNWSLMNRINQKGTRPQDQPVPITELTDEEQATIQRHYPELFVSDEKNE